MSEGQSAAGVEAQRGLSQVAGLDQPSRWRGLHAVHEATVLACEVVDDAVPAVAGRHASRADRLCTIDAVATASGLRASIDLPAGVDVDPTRGGGDALRFVRLFSDDVAWSFGPGQRRLTVVVRSEALAVTS